MTFDLAHPLHQRAADPERVGIKGVKARVALARKEDDEEREK